jgi:hypothetical protein
MDKNITQFMSVYSLSTPELEAKRASRLKVWEKFDFPSMVFTIDKVQSLGPDDAVALVTWYIDIWNRSTQELTSDTQTYQVRFVKVLGAWRIRGQEEVEQ